MTRNQIIAAVITAVLGFAGVGYVVTTTDTGFLIEKTDAP